MEWRANSYLISTDPQRVDRDAVWRFLRTSYWATGIEREVVDRAIDNSLVFGMLDPSISQHLATMRLKLS